MGVPYLQVGLIGISMLDFKNQLELENDIATDASTAMCYIICVCIFSLVDLKCTHCGKDLPVNSHRTEVV